MKTKILYIILLAVIIYGCDRFNSDKIDDAVARVNDSYLYKEDLKHIIPNNVSKADSTFLANNYINNWASNLLLMDKALLNLPEKQQESFNSLVKQYENDLYTKAYLEALVKRSIDTTVSKVEADTIYQRNKESFKLNDELLKLRYINLPQNAVNLEVIKSKFKKFEKNDKVFLDSIAVQFRSYSLNDSVWVRASQVIEKIHVANQSNKNQLLKKCLKMKKIMELKNFQLIRFLQKKY